MLSFECYGFFSVDELYMFSQEFLQQHFDEFFEDVYVELEDKYGPIEELNVCENLGDHLIGKNNRDSCCSIHSVRIDFTGALCC